MNWKLTKQAEEAKKVIANEEDTEIPSFGGSDGFWYDLTAGGYFRPEEALEDKEQLEKVNEAVKLLKDLEDNVYDKINFEV